MHCSNCGSYIAPGVRFCSNCGSPAADPEATKIARSQVGALTHTAEGNDLEHIVFTVRPTLLFVKIGYVISMIAAILLIVLLASIGAPAYISVPLAVALLLIP